MGTVAEILNKYLPMFDHNDRTYKSVISDVDGVPNATITKPTDFNIGAIANLLEYNRHLTIFLREQIYLNKAVGAFLDYFVSTIFNMYRYEGEDDTAFATRVAKYILAHRMSPASIIDAVKQYSSQLPEIIEGELDSAFADVTYSDNYTSFICANDSDSVYYRWWVLPAIPCGIDSGAFYFILVMYNLDPNNIAAVVDIVNNWKVAGVAYHIEVRCV